MRRLQITLLTLLLLACNGLQAAITGAVTSGAGELAIINSDREAAWSVSPAEHMASYAVSDDGKTVYFASPKPGAVTFYAASVVDGLPNIESYTLYNGVEAPDDKDPTPAPVLPTPEPETVKTVIDKTDTGATADDYNALANAFEAVVSGIDRGTITTPAGARETFRALWLQMAAKTNPAAIGNFSGLLDALSAKIDNTDLQAIRKDYGDIVTDLRVKSETLKPKAQAKPAPVQASPGGCANGQCYRGWGW